MQHLFSRANEALHRDLAAYAETLRAIVMVLPHAYTLNDRVLKEVRLIDALLAFGSGPHVVEIGQIAFHLQNLWAFREQAQARTAGFLDEIRETREHCEQARHGLKLLARYHDDALAAELKICLQNILAYLEEELRLLEECQQNIRPFVSSPDITCKRLNLLVAAAEARLADSPERRTAVSTYSEAAALLREWEGGVPLDERGVAILERCLDIINQSSTIFGILTMPAIISPAAA